MTKGFRFIGRTDERMAALVQQLDPPVPFTLDGFRTRLEEHCHRTIRMISTPMPPGAPSGVWLRTDSTDFLYYEEQTSAFHQAHIVASLAAQLLLAGTAGARISRQLVPDVDVHPQRLLPGARIGDAVSRTEAEAFAFEVLRRSCPFPGDLRARVLLRRMRPLHSALLAAVPPAAHAAGPRSLVGATARLYEAVIEIRDAALALRAHDARGVVATLPTRGSTAETSVQGRKAAIEAAFIQKLDTALSHQERRADPLSVITGRADLNLEASKLIECARHVTSPTGR